MHCAHANVFHFPDLLSLGSCSFNLTTCRPASKTLNEKVGLLPTQPTYKVSDLERGYGYVRP